jgi:tRNA(fMet)-specific endonuclease VapC
MLKAKNAKERKMYLLDTNIISFLVKENKTREKEEDKIKEERIVHEVFKLKAQNAIIKIPITSYYEIRRHIIRKNALKQLNKLEKLCQEYELLYLNDLEIMNIASDIWAALMNNGRPIGKEGNADMDIITAAIAIHNKLTVLTNDPDFNTIGEIYSAKQLLFKIIT